MVSALVPLTFRYSSSVTTSVCPGLNRSFRKWLVLTLVLRGQWTCLPAGHAELGRGPGRRTAAVRRSLQGAASRALWRRADNFRVARGARRTRPERAGAC